MIFVIKNGVRVRYSSIAQAVNQSGLSKTLFAYLLESGRTVDFVSVEFTPECLMNMLALEHLENSEGGYLTGKEIAELENTSRQTVHNVINSALEKARRIFKDATEKKNKIRKQFY